MKHLYTDCSSGTQTGPPSGKPLSALDGIARRATLWGLLCLALMSASVIAGPPSMLPKGSIIAFMPDPRAKQYRDLESLRGWLKADGWAICDGRDGAPDLRERFIMGASYIEEAGQRLGSKEHRHKLDLRTAQEQGRARRVGSGKMHAYTAYPHGHRHRLTGQSAVESNLPLSLKLIFIMRIHD